MENRPYLRTESLLPLASPARPLSVDEWTLTPDFLSLRRGAWCLVRQGGPALPLTRAEQAVLACLFRAPGRRVPAVDLTRAVLRVWQPPGNRQPRNSADLPVMLGRLRARARRAAMVLPLWQSADTATWAWGLLRDHGSP